MWVENANIPFAAECRLISDPNSRIHTRGGDGNEMRFCVRLNGGGDGYNSSVVCVVFLSGYGPVFARTSSTVDVWAVVLGHRLLVACHPDNYYLNIK